MEAEIEETRHFQALKMAALPKKDEKSRPKPKPVGIKISDKSGANAQVATRKRNREGKDDKSGVEQVMKRRRKTGAENHTK